MIDNVLKTVITIISSMIEKPVVQGGQRGLAAAAWYVGMRLTPWDANGPTCWS